MEFSIDDLFSSAQSILRVFSALMEKVGNALEFRQ